MSESWDDADLAIELDLEDDDDVDNGWDATPDDDEE